ncbi:MAG TPA: YceI family protein [Chitinophagaceae bacterium]|nr:YceI family protein [Chitinophagaceae bacterium]
MMKKIISVLALALLFFGSPLYSQSNYRMESDYSFIIRGGSNIRDWAESVDDADGIASISMADEGHLDINEVRILIRANEIKSIGVEGTAMNKKTYETLKTNQYPTITFMVTTPVRSLATDGKKHLIETDGILTIAGNRKIIKLHPIISANTDGKIDIEGDVVLKMSDFGIEPPVTLFGLLRVKDGFTVHFRIRLTPDIN